MISGALRASVEARLGRTLAASPVGGGCISHAARVETADGPVFLKHNAEAPPGLFAAEADGLRALRAAAGDALRVPEVIAVHDSMESGDGDDAPAWIALEWLEPAPSGRGHSGRLGRGLAHLHRAPVDGRWGWARDNFIGALPQSNAPSPAWPAFWRDRRLAPQLDLARRAHRLPGTEGEWERLLDRLPDLLAAGDEDGASLLHGDLWSGNVMATAGGPALIDPAAYRGHREADLAMAELFGGFDAAFHAAYREAWPLLPGYAEARRGVYQLYYLLVHVNLFGGGYVAQTAAALRRVAAG
ncbi:MAG TPA: fructosamine kinase family protein [Longimicrobium sp.]|nr:fructosamine kinase family protein [Longimicrobium sp.]